MLIAIVQIPWTSKQPGKEAFIARAKVALPTYTNMKGLIRKDYLNGETAGGGVYLWESKAAADAWFNDTWWAFMQEKFGVRPTLQYFDHYLTVDNAKGEVRVDGSPIVLAVKAAE